MKIPITKPFFGPEEREAIQKPLESGWVVQGPYTQDFEAKIRAFTGAAHAAAASTCTAALHLSVAALGVKPGDEVIVPAFTWVSTANVVEYMGARPVFCDIDLRTFNIDASRIESLITDRTVGILPVHLFGLCAEMDPILKIAEKHGLWVVEDAACALGARYDGKHAGTFGETGCFSFHPRKSITTGEGGMVVTGDAALCAQIESLRDHGASKTDYDRHHGAHGFLLAEYPVLGFNYRMTDLQGALGSVQMDRLEWILSERIRLARRYDECLLGTESLQLPCVPQHCVHAYQTYVTLFHPAEASMRNAGRLYEERNQLMARLEERGIATRQGTHAPVIQEYYAKRYGFVPEDYPNSVLADRLSLALPLYVQMTEEEQDYVIENLKAAL